MLFWKNKSYRDEGPVENPANTNNFNVDTFEGCKDYWSNLLPDSCMSNPNDNRFNRKSCESIGQCTWCCNYVPADILGVYPIDRFYNNGNKKGYDESFTPYGDAKNWLKQVNPSGDYWHAIVFNDSSTFFNIKNNNNYFGQENIDNKTFDYEKYDIIVHADERSRNGHVTFIVEDYENSKDAFLKGKYLIQNSNLCGDRLCTYNIWDPETNYFYDCDAYLKNGSQVVVDLPLQIASPSGVIRFDSEKYVNDINYRTQILLGKPYFEIYNNVNSLFPSFSYYSLHSHHGELYQELYNQLIEEGKQTKVLPSELGTDKSLVLEYDITFDNNFFISKEDAALTETKMDDFLANTFDKSNERFDTVFNNIKEKVEGKLNLGEPAYSAYNNDFEEGIVYFHSGDNLVQFNIYSNDRYEKVKELGDSLELSPEAVNAHEWCVKWVNEQNTKEEAINQSISQELNIDLQSISCLEATTHSIIESLLGTHSDRDH